MKMLKDIKFFIKESPSFMKGNRFWWLGYPRAFYNFMKLCQKGR